MEQVSKLIELQQGANQQQTDPLKSASATRELHAILLGKPENNSQSGVGHNEINQATSHHCHLEEAISAKQVEPSHNNCESSARQNPLLAHSSR